VRTGEAAAAGAEVFSVLRTARSSILKARAPSRIPFGASSNGLLASEAPTDAADAVALSRVKDWHVWQLIDSAFPTGGFAHSFGLEAAWQHGEVRNRAELISFAEATLNQLGHAALPFVSAAFDEPNKLGELDQLCNAFTTNHIANRASRAQGRSFLTAVKRIFKCEIRNPESEIEFAHFAPVFGACLRWLEISRELTSRIFFFNHLRSVMAASVRLNIVGPMEAQILQHRLATEAEAVFVKCKTLTLDDIAQTSPLLDLWQGAQDRLYSRLFQS
jgi:urease accessory protein